METASHDSLRLGHVGYTTGNLEEALDFYCGKLGIENSKVQVSDQPYLSDVTGHRECKLKIGFTSPKDALLPFEIIEYLNPKVRMSDRGLRSTGSSHVSWEVDDLLVAFHRIEAKNAKALAPAARITNGIWKGAIAAYFADPSGLINQLIEVSPQKGGAGRITRLHHVCYVIDDMDAALEFLCGKMGMELVARMENGDDLPIEDDGPGRAPHEAAYVRYPETDFVIELRRFGNSEKMPAISSNMVGNVHLCIKVGRIGQLLDRLGGAGVSLLAGPPAEVTAGVNKGAYAKYMPPCHGIICELFQGSPIRVG